MSTRRDVLIRISLGLLALPLHGCEQQVVNPRILETYEQSCLRELRRGLDAAPGSAARRESLERALDSASTVERAAGSDTGLRPALALLLAAELPERDLRERALTRLLDDGGDPQAIRLVQGQLERDPKWLSEELTSDSLYSDFTAFLNGVTQTVSAALTGNPIGTLQPLILGIEGVVRGQPLDPRDRKRIALERRLRLEGNAPSAVEYAELRERVDQLADQTSREELWLSQRSLEERDFASALAHLRVAELLDLHHAEAAELRTRIEERIRARRAALDSSLVVTLDPHSAPEDAERVEPLLLIEPRPARRHPLAGQTVLAALAAREGDESAQGDDAEIRKAESERRAAVWRFVFTGRRPSLDPLERHVEARRAETRSWLDVVAPILWLPSTLVRGGYAIVGNPIDDRRVIDAQARFVRRNLGSPERPEILAELARRYAQRGEPWKAICAWREIDSSTDAVADAKELARAEKQLAEDMLDEDATRAVRLSRLDWLERALPDTEWAEQARVTRAEILAEPESRSVPIGVARAFVPAISLDPRWSNQDERDGELDPPRVEIAGERVFVRVRTGSQRQFVDLELDAVDRARLAALAEEWAWRFAAARAETYASRHRGIPVELYAGLGANGLAFYPRLLPETYSADDESFYR